MSFVSMVCCPSGSLCSAHRGVPCQAGSAESTEAVGRSDMHVEAIEVSVGLMEPGMWCLPLRTCSGVLNMG